MQPKIEGFTREELVEITQLIRLGYSQFQSECHALAIQALMDDTFHRVTQALDRAKQEAEK